MKYQINFQDQETVEIIGEERHTNLPPLEEKEEPSDLQDSSDTQVQMANCNQSAKY